MTRDNHTRFIILGFLSHEPMTGYDIKKRITENIGHFWDLSFGQIYPALRDLERDGLVTMVVERNEGGPDRKIYTITDGGRAELKRWLVRPVKREILRYEVLLKLFFGAGGEPENILCHVEGFRERNVTDLRKMLELEKELRDIPDLEKDHLYYLLTVLMGKKVFEAHIEWSDEVIDILKQRNRPGGPEV